MTQYKWHKEIKAPAEQPTNMVTVPLNKLEDMQRRLKVTQERIAELEAELETGRNCYNDALKDCVELEAKLAIAVEALEIFNSTLGEGNVAMKALTKIKGE